MIQTTNEKVSHSLVHSVRTALRLHDRCLVGRCYTDAMTVTIAAPVQRLSPTVQELSGVRQIALTSLGTP